MIHKTGVSLTLTQVLMVVVVWLWIVPLLTCWMWRLGFTTSFSHGWNTVSQRMSPLLLLADCIQARRTDGCTYYPSIVARGWDSELTGAEVWGGA